MIMNDIEPQPPRDIELLGQEALWDLASGIPEGSVLTFEIEGELYQGELEFDLLLGLPRITMQTPASDMVRMRLAGPDFISSMVDIQIPQLEGP